MPRDQDNKNHRKLWLGNICLIGYFYWLKIESTVYARVIVYPRGQKSWSVAFHDDLCHETMNDAWGERPMLMSRRLSNPSSFHCCLCQDSSLLLVCLPFRLCISNQRYKRVKRPRNSSSLKKELRLDTQLFLLHFLKMHLRNPVCASSEKSPEH